MPALRLFAFRYSTPAGHKSYGASAAKLRQANACGRWIAVGGKSASGFAGTRGPVPFCRWQVHPAMLQRLV